MARKSIDYYMAFPYRVEVYPEEDGKGFSALIPDLPGCMTSADSYADLGRMVDEAKRLWLEVALEDGIPIPAPKPVEVEEYSGKFVLRIAKTLHRQLAALAEEEGVSLNNLVGTLVTRGLGIWYGERTKSIVTLEMKYRSGTESESIPWSQYVTEHQKESEGRKPSPEWTPAEAPIRCIAESRGKYA